MKLRITTDDILHVPFDQTFSRFIREGGDQWFHLPPGKEHYRLLTYLSTQFSNSTLLDIGTYTGTSALSLSYNPSNMIHSFDIVDCVGHPILKSIPTVKYHLENLWDETTIPSYISLLKSSPLIFLDVNPHNGIMEFEFYKLLKRINYSGILVCDDIHHFEGMRHFWLQIPNEEKFDLTKYGHWSGTGLILFDKNIEIELGN